MLLYLIALSLNLAIVLSGLIANELVKGPAHRPLLMEWNSTVRLRSCTCIATILNQSKYSLNGFCGPYRIAFKESEVFLYTQLEEKQFRNTCESLTKSWINLVGSDENHRRAAISRKVGNIRQSKRDTCFIYLHHIFKHGHMDLRVSSSIIWLQCRCELEIF